METIAKIRLKYYQKKESISGIARDMRMARNTVKEILRTGKTEQVYRRGKQVEPKLGEYGGVLEEMLSHENKLPRKERRTARRLYERLKELGYMGAYDSVQRRVKRWRKEAGQVKAAFIPLQFAPGEAYQFDWSTERVELGGVIQTIKVAHFRLCYSRVFFVMAYLRESQEMLFDAHNKAWLYFGGMTLRGIYDNLKTAVDTVFVGKERRFNRRFIQMMSHYVIEPTACTPAAGWEKGQVENQVGNIREWLFTPRLKFADLSSLNTWLEQRCTEIAKSRQHPDMTGQTLWEAHEQERSALRPLMPVFDGCIKKEYRISTTCLVQFDRNRYSVDCRYANQTASVRAYADRVVMVCEGKMIGEHLRQFGRNVTVYNPLHYLRLLERKPGALRNGAPFQNWNLPQPIQAVRAQLMKRKGGDHDCVKVLQAIPTYGLEAVTTACECALKEKAINADYILNRISRLVQPQKAEVILTPEHLQLALEPLANCERYNHLLNAA